jgi:hypothetical protein
LANNRTACEFQDRSASSLLKRETAAMEQRQHQGQAALLWQAGLDIAATIRVSGGGRKMFLDIPFYRTPNRGMFPEVTAVNAL